MSMSPQALGNIPEETARIAWAACPKGTLAMRLRDALGELYQDEQFVDLYPAEGQTGVCPPPGWRWSPCCKIPRISPIGRRPMRCVSALIGSMCLDES